MTVDYLPKYLKDGVFDFPRLLNDDFFEPIRLLFNHRHYVSAAKLLMTMIDSIGFVEFGDSGDNPFRKWLDRYADLAALGITSEELWEHRNSLLHMSNLDSRRVVSGRVRRLMSYVGRMPDGFLPEEQNTKFYDLLALIRSVAGACTLWVQSFDQEPEKFEVFLDRYDLIVSDNRRLEFNGGPEPRQVRIGPLGSG